MHENRRGTEKTNREMRDICGALDQKNRKGSTKTRLNINRRGWESKKQRGKFLADIRTDKLDFA